VTVFSVLQITKALIATEHVMSLIERSPEGAAASTGGQVPDGIEGRVELRDVTFDYPVRGAEVASGGGGGDPRAGPLLHNFSLTIAAGSMTGIVGARHSGKTAVVELIQRMYDADAGSVLLDGLDVRTLDSEWLREKVAVVHQEPVLLGMTIAQNIAFALDSATQVPPYSARCCSVLLGVARCCVARRRISPPPSTRRRRCRQCRLD